jgi:serine protease Do
MLQKVLPAIVNVSVRGELQQSSTKKGRIANTMPKFEDTASGVIVDANKGYLITNAHVVKDGKLIVITLNDSRQFTARIIGYDLPSDVAVLQINAKHLNAIVLGDSDKVKVGDFVSAIGNPFGLQQTVTYGVVSGLERSNLGIEGFENFIQTDASLNPGNSGGALVNMNGELIGINTALITAAPIAGNIGVGLSIPSNMAKSVTDQLIKYGKVERGALGVLIQNITPSLKDVMNLPSTEGCLISEVFPNTPAAEAGLMSKDVIVSIMGKPIHSASQVTMFISLLRVNSKVDIQILRDGKIINKTAVITKIETLQKNAQLNQNTLLSDLQLRDFNELINGEQVKGVEVIYASYMSSAFTSGIRSKDIIISAANKPISSIEELQKIAAQNPTQLLLEIKRSYGGNLFLVLEK